MKITVDGKAYDFDEESMLNTEAMALEAAMGMPTQQWSELLQKGSVSALTGLVWLVRRREEPALRFSEVEFALAKLVFDDDAVDPTEPVPASS